MKDHMQLVVKRELQFAT